MGVGRGDEKDRGRPIFIAEISLLDSFSLEDTVPSAGEAQQETIAPSLPVIVYAKNCPGKRLTTLRSSERRFGALS